MSGRSPGSVESVKKTNKITKLIILLTDGEVRIVSHSQEGLDDDATRDPLKRKKNE